MSKFAARGTILKYDTGSSTFVTVPQLGDVSLQQPQRERVDVTTHDSAGGYREFVDTFLGEGTLPFTLVYDPANASHEWLRNKQQVGGTGNFKYILPDAGAAEFAFVGQVLKFDIGTAVNGKVEVTGEIKTTGAITFAA